jgi:hypothetical protein
MKIFVQMIAYKNDVVATMRDCILNSSNKENLYFGICLQQDEETPPELNHPRIKVSRVPISQSKGPGWALHQAQSFYDGQDYTMLVDSKSRFSKDWDKELINALESLGSPKPIITNYPSRFEEAKTDRDLIAYRPVMYQLIDNPLVWPVHMKGATEPSKNNWISSLFFFTKGSHCTDCPHDPEIYYHEIEPSLTIRSFTLGYDIFSYHKPIVWRDYAARKMNWDDDQDWWLKNKQSKVTFNNLIQGNLTQYGLGSERSLRDFELYSGIDFVNKTIHKSSSTGVAPPYQFENEDQWKNQFQKDYNIVVKWNINEIEKCDDYDYWYFSVEDEQDGTIFRQDIRPDRDADLISFKNNYKRLIFKAPLNKIPKKVCVWPVSKSKGWLKKTKFEL